MVVCKVGYVIAVCLIDILINIFPVDIEQKTFINSYNTLLKRCWLTDLTTFDC